MWNKMQSTRIHSAKTPRNVTHNDAQQPLLADKHSSTNPKRLLVPTAIEFQFLTDKIQKMQNFYSNILLLGQTSHLDTIPA